MAKEVGISPGGTIRYGITFCLILAVWNFFRSYLLLLMLALMVCGAAVSFLLLWGGRGSSPASRPGRKNGAVSFYGPGT